MMHVAPGSCEADHAPALVGFVVPKTVGNAVVRNRVERRLRHLMRDRVAALTPGERCVIRVFPSARGASSLELGADLDRVLAKVRRRGEEVGS